MKYLLVILLCLPLICEGQIITYTTIDWDDMTTQHLTDDDDTSDLKALYSDFVLGTINYYDSTQIIEDDGEWGTKFLRQYLPDTSGCCDAECNTDDNPGFYLIGDIIDSTAKDEIFYSVDLRFGGEAGHGWNGGTNGGKIIHLSSHCEPDTAAWDILIMFEPGDTTLFTWYYYDYNRHDVDAGATNWTDFWFYTDSVYNITVNIDIGDLDSDNSNWALFVDGICVDVMSGQDLNSTGAADCHFGRITDNFFFGGGGCGPEHDTWIDRGLEKIWWPSPAAVTAGDYNGVGTAYSVGDTITLPQDFHCNSYIDCSNYYWETGCESKTVVDGRTDGVCAEAESGTTGNTYFRNKLGTKKFRNKDTEFIIYR